MSPQPVDAALHRCGDCGGWLYANRPCNTCTVIWAFETQEAS